MGNRQIIDLACIVDEAGKLRRMFPHQGGSMWIPHGDYLVNREDGSRVMEVTYHRGVAHGPYLDYWSNGVVSLDNL